MRWVGPVGLALVTSVIFGGACALSTHGLEPGSGGGGAGGATSSSTTTSSSSSGTSSSSSGTGGTPCTAGTKACGGECVSTDDPMFGCAGAACDPCTNDHGTTACAAGVCAPTCEQGFADCNTNPNDGCELDITTLTDCGACGVACTNAHGTTACTGGVCVPACDKNFLDCNSNPNDGCEAGTETDVANCGACGVACTNGHGTTVCTGSKCAPTCDPGYADCNNDPNDGCETGTDSDIANCGSCGRKCSASNVAALACSGGLCTSTCLVGFANCSQPTGNDDGCERNVAGDDNHCGGCGNSCKNPAFTDDPDCNVGSATQKVCGCDNNNECKWGTGTNPSCNNTTGLCTCDNVTCQPGEGCKHVLTADVCTCYGGNACAAGESCCQTPLGCFNLQADANNCGACGHKCAPGFNCNQGQCGCAANDANCNGGAAAGTFTCFQQSGADVCMCGTTKCAIGQRCLADGTCG